MPTSKRKRQDRDAPPIPPGDSRLARGIYKDLQAIDPHQSISVRALLLELSRRCQRWSPKNPDPDAPRVRYVPEAAEPHVQGAAFGLWDALENRHVSIELWDALTDIDDRSLARLVARLAGEDVGHDAVAPWLREREAGLISQIRTEIAPAGDESEVAPSQEPAR